MRTKLVAIAAAAVVAVTVFAARANNQPRSPDRGSLDALAAQQGKMTEAFWRQQKQVAESVCPALIPAPQGRGQRAVWMPMGLCADRLNEVYLRQGWTVVNVVAEAREGGGWIVVVTHP
jgi:hypothetical protein